MKKKAFHLKGRLRLVIASLLSFSSLSVKAFINNDVFFVQSIVKSYSHPVELHPHSFLVGMTPLGFGKLSSVVVHCVCVGVWST